MSLGIRAHGGRERALPPSPLRAFGAMGGPRGGGASMSDDYNARRRLGGALTMRSMRKR